MRRWRARVHFDLGSPGRQPQFQVPTATYGSLEEGNGVVMDRPDTQFAWNSDVALAYQLVGAGPADLLYLPGILSNVDVMWENPRPSQH